MNIVSKMTFTGLLLLLTIAMSKIEAIEELNCKKVDLTEAAAIYELSLPPDTLSKSMDGVVVIKRLNGEYSESPLFIQKNGSLYTVDKQQVMVFGFSGGYGEKFEVVLVTIDDHEKITPVGKCEIIPFPLGVEDDQRHKMSIEPITADGKNFQIHGSGFTPKEKLTMNIRSCDEALSCSIPVDDKGGFSFLCAPAVIGKDAGPLEVVLSGDKVKSLKLRHYWGKAAFVPPNQYHVLKEKYKFPDEK